jgi:hypothetical protein
MNDIGHDFLHDLLLPCRTLESLARRAARGHRASWSQLLRHLPRIIEAEHRWLYPALLHRHPGGARRVLTMPLTGEHEQMLDMIETLASRTAPPHNPMARALQATLLQHARSERTWLERVLRSHPVPLRTDTALARYVAHCAPMLAQARDAMAADERQPHATPACSAFPLAA